MNVVEGSEPATRRIVTIRLLRVLHEPGPLPRLHAAARLLQQVAAPDDAPALEVLLLDRERDAWIRTYMLRAFARPSFAISSSALAAVCDELAAAPPPAGPRATPWSFTAAENARAVLGLARDADHDAILVAFTRDWPSAAARAALLGRVTRTQQPRRAVRDALYARSLAGAELDDALAWATLDQPASRARVLDRAPLDVVALATATRGWDDRAVEAAFGDRPEVLRLARAARTPPPAAPFDVHGRSRADLAALLTFASNAPVDRALLAWAVEQPEPALQQAGLRGLLILDGSHVDPAVLDRLAASPAPLVRLLVAEGRLATDPGARDALMHAARHAPHVVLRAQALRSLRAATPRPIALFRDALATDHEAFELYYLPAVSEAALGLSRCADITAGAALDALVDAYLDLRHDDAPFALEAAIASWLDGTAAEIRPVWYARYTPDFTDRASSTRRR